MDSWTNNLEPAQHTWPWFNQIASTKPSIAPSISASSKIINGDFPPNSRVIDFSDPANFARYGSAEEYYNQSIIRIKDLYPYDGSRS